MGQRLFYALEIYCLVISTIDSKFMILQNENWYYYSRWFLQYDQRSLETAKLHCPKCLTFRNNCTLTQIWIWTWECSCEGQRLMLLLVSDVLFCLLWILSIKDSNYITVIKGKCHRALSWCIWRWHIAVSIPGSTETGRGHSGWAPSNFSFYDTAFCD